MFRSSNNSRWWRDENHSYPATYAAKYPKGAVATVHYDPRNPSEAVLDVSYKGLPMLLLGIAIVLIYAGYVVWLNSGGRAGTA